MITRINESKKLTKPISYKCECKFDDKYKKCNNDKCWFERKKTPCVQKNYIWNPATYSCENGKYVASIIDDSVVICDETIEETKTV